MCIYVYTYTLVQIQLIDTIDQEMYRKTDWIEGSSPLGLSIKKVILKLMFRQERSYSMYGLEYLFVVRHFKITCLYN